MLANKDFCTAHFSTNQLRVGSPKGTETCVHAVQSYLQDPSSKGKVLVNTTFENSLKTVQFCVAFGGCGTIGTLRGAIFCFEHGGGNSPFLIEL